MPKLFIILLFLMSFYNTDGQTPPADSLTIEKILDDDILNFLDSVKNPSSYFTLTIGVGNKLFSVNNNSVNSSQAQVNKLFLTTALSYQQQKGFGFSVMPYVSSNNGSLKVYQTALTPFYNLSDKKFDFNISYTRYLADYKSYNSNATYQNDLFTSATFTKGYIEPSISLGYTSGNFKEINTIPIQLPNRIVYVKDSTNNAIKNFSVSAGLEHSFKFKKVFQSNSSVAFTPRFLIIAGSQNYAATHTNKSYEYFINKSTRFRSRTKTANEPFKFQSLALSLDAIYSVGNFFVSPNFYLDYYLPQTNSKKFTHVYAITVGTSF